MQLRKTKNQFFIPFDEKQKPPTFAKRKISKPSINSKLIHINIQSISNCLKLNEFVNKHNCQFLAVTELWRSAEEIISHNSTNFKLVSSFCRNTGEHGGSALYVRDCFSNATTEKKEFVRMGCPYSFECSAVCVKTVDNIIIIASIYRSPSGNNNVDIFFEKLIILLQTLTDMKLPYLVAGDFNIHTEPSANDPNKSTFLSSVESFNATLVIKTPTRN